MQHGELRTLRCPLSVDKLFMLIFTYFSYIFIAGSRNSHGATRIESISEEVRGNSSHGPAETENPNENDDNEEVRVLNTTVIHVSCLVLCRTWHWPAAQVLSHPLHPLHLRFRRSHLCAQALWSSTLMRCSTAEWRINTNPVSLRLWAQVGWDQRHRHRSDRAWRPRAQKNWAWQESWNRSVSKTGKIGEKLYHWRYGWIWWSWCRDVLLPFTDAFRLWLSGEHCRLGSWRWRTTKNAGFTTVFAKSRRLWILSNANRTGETCCIVFIGKRRTTKTHSRVLSSKTLIRQIGEDISSWREQRSLAQSGKSWNYEAGTPSWISQ